jgi:hypothetical protein
MNETCRTCTGFTLIDMHQAVRYGLYANTYATWGSFVDWGLGISPNLTPQK